MSEVKFSVKVIEAANKELQKIANAKQGKSNPYLYVMLQDVLLLEEYYKAVVTGNAKRCDELYMQMDTIVSDKIPNRIFNAVDRSLYE